MLPADRPTGRPGPSNSPRGQTHRSQWTLLEMLQGPFQAFIPVIIRPRRRISTRTCSQVPGCCPNCMILAKYHCVCVSAYRGELKAEGAGATTRLCGQLPKRV